jgi:hypothetical protein
MPAFATLEIRFRSLACRRLVHWTTYRVAVQSLRRCFGFSRCRHGQLPRVRARCLPRASRRSSPATAVSPARRASSACAWAARTLAHEKAAAARRDPAMGRGVRQQVPLAPCERAGAWGSSDHAMAVGSGRNRNGLFTCRVLGSRFLPLSSALGGPRKAPRPPGPGAFLVESWVWSPLGEVCRPNPAGRRADPHGSGVASELAVCHPQPGSRADRTPDLLSRPWHGSPPRYSTHLRPCIEWPRPNHGRLGFATTGQCGDW